TCSVSSLPGTPRSGSSQRPTVIRYSMQMPTNTMPSGANSNRVKPTPTASRPIASTSRLVEVPIRVHTPAACDMYDSGIRNFDGAQRLAVLAASTRGRNTATVAVLLTNAATLATSTSITSMNSHCQRILDSTSPTATRAPLRCSAPLSTNIAATITVAWLLKPDSASGTVITPVTISAVITSSATTSTRS